jgi:hypothetical protein
MSGKTEEKKKDGWDKWQIVLEPMGGLLTALAVVFLTIYSSEKVTSLQEQQNNARVYTELLGKREESETALRKAMFDSIMTAFLQSAGKSEQSPSSPATVKSEDPLELDIMKLELLAYNFNESLNLVPLFKHLERKINQKLKTTPRDLIAQDYLNRLRKIGNDIVGKQLAILRDPDGKNSMTFQTGRFSDPPPTDEAGQSIPNRVSNRLFVGGITHDIAVTIVSKNPDIQELKVSLEITTPRTEEDDSSKEMPATRAIFEIGSFEFPLIDNTRLPNDQRCALILRCADDTSEDLTEQPLQKRDAVFQIDVVCFPGSRAAMKEKPYYDEVLDRLRMANDADSKVKSRKRAGSL